MIPRRPLGRPRQRERGADPILGASPPSYVIRRRRITALVLALAVVGGIAAGVVVVLAGSNSRDKRESPLSGFAGGSARAGSGSKSSPLRTFVHRLPRERQVAQLFVVGFEGRYPRDPFFRQLAGRDWGGVVLDRQNFVDSSQLQALAGEVTVVARRAGHLPPLVAAAQEGGDQSAFPGLAPAAQPEVGGSERPAEAGTQARAAAAALKALRVNMTLAPVADVGTLGGGVQARVFSDDPALVTQMVHAAVSAYRSARIISAVGHFPGQGATSQDPRDGTATVGLPLPDLRRRDVPPFAAVARAAPVVIVSNAVYAAFDGVTPATLLPAVINGLLRDKLGFRGVVMTDDLVDTSGVTGKSVGDAAVAALKAGDDLLYVSGGTAEQEQAFGAVLAAIRKGELSRDRIEASVARVLALKQSHGLFSLPKRAKKQ